MAGENRKSSTAVELEEAPWLWDFFQAARRLECEHQQAPRIGEAQRLAQEFVLFAQKAELSYPLSSLKSIEFNDDTVKLFVRFLGLLSVNGPLPLHVQEHTYRRAYNYFDHTSEDFLNIFNHRLISLFYKAWAMHQQTVNYDRKSTDKYAFYLKCLIGENAYLSDNYDDLPSKTKVFYSGRLAAYVSGSESLAEVLQDYFKVPVQVLDFEGEWLRIPRDARFKLGESASTGTLGDSIVMGQRVWQSQSKIKIVIGALDLEDYLRFLPGRPSLKKLICWVDNFIGKELAVAVNIILKKEQVPKLQLGSSALLGWNSWMGTQAHHKHAKNLTVNFNI